MALTLNDKCAIAGIAIAGSAVAGWDDCGIAVGGTWTKIESDEATWSCDEEPTTATTYIKLHCKDG